MIILKERSQREREKIKGSRFIAVADRIAANALHAAADIPEVFGVP